MVYAHTNINEGWKKFLAMPLLTKNTELEGEMRFIPILITQCSWVTRMLLKVVYWNIKLQVP